MANFAYENLIANLSGGVRRERLDGRDYFVAPLSLVVPGILNGSRGPLLYTKEDAKKHAKAWDGSPIVVYHPTRNGKPISASDPAVVHIGVVKNSKFNDKVQAEAWIDVENAKDHDERVYDALVNGTPMEVSTGLGTDIEAVAPGTTLNGEFYTGIARNWRSDHLALLPDQTGACSLRDGCGLMINKVDKSDEPEMRTITLSLNEAEIKEETDKFIENLAKRAVKDVANCDDSGECEACKAKRLAKVANEEDAPEPDVTNCKGEVECPKCKAKRLKKMEESGETTNEESVENVDLVTNAEEFYDISEILNCGGKGGKPGVCPLAQGKASTSVAPKNLAKDISASFKSDHKNNKYGETARKFQSTSAEDVSAAAHHLGKAAKTAADHEMAARLHVFAAEKFAEKGPTPKGVHGEMYEGDSPKERKTSSQEDHHQKLSDVHSHLASTMSWKPKTPADARKRTKVLAKAKKSLQDHLTTKTENAMIDDLDVQNLLKRIENCKATGKPGPCAKGGKEADALSSKANKMSAKLTKTAWGDVRGFSAKSHQVASGAHAAAGEAHRDAGNKPKAGEHSYMAGLHESAARQGAHSQAVSQLSKMYVTKGQLLRKKGYFTTTNQSNDVLESIVANSGDFTKGGQLMADKKLTDSDRLKLVDHLITNSAIWEEDDREVLNAFDDVKLYKLAEQTMVDNEDPDESDDDDGDADETPTPTTNKGKVPPQFLKGKKKKAAAEDDEDEEDEEMTENRRPLTEAEWLAQAPKSIRSVVQNAQRKEAQEKQTLVANMTEHLDDEQKSGMVKLLNAKSLDELQLLSSLKTTVQSNAEVPTLNYAGQVGTFRSVNNKAKVNPNDGLEVPVINWKQESKAS